MFVEDKDFKVHIHTNVRLCTAGSTKGWRAIHLKIDNMKMQHNHVIAQQKKPHKPYAFVAVASGEGLKNLFLEIGVDEIVHGGQSMNPGTDDILNVCNKLNADVIFVLPNNKNIILAAEQAKGLTDAKIIVIPTKSIPQGISAVLAFDPDETPENNEKLMNDAIVTVKTGLVTFASRDTKFGEQVIKSGNILGLENSKLSLVGDDINTITNDLIKKMGIEGGEVITLFYGKDVIEEMPLASQIEANYPNCDIILLMVGNHFITTLYQ